MAKKTGSSLPGGSANRPAELVVITGLSGSGKASVLKSLEGGHHRSVMIADQIRKRLDQAGFKVKVNHRDMAKGG